MLRHMRLPNICRQVRTIFKENDKEHVETPFPKQLDSTTCDPPFGTETKQRLVVGGNSV